VLCVLTPSVSPVLGLIGNLEVNFPIEFHANMDWVDSFSLDTTALESLEFPKLEVRWQFLVYGTLFPLSFTLMMLLFFNEFYIVVWYFVFLFSICMLGASFALLVMPRTSDKFFGNTPFPAENVRASLLSLFRRDL